MASIVCAHCGISFHWKKTTTTILNASPSPGESPDGAFEALHTKCPTCSRVMIWLKQYPPTIGNRRAPEPIELLVWPQTGGRRAPPPEVPSPYREDYIEAACVLNASAKASAALSRRILQHLLHEHLQIKAKNLDLEITELLNRKVLPSWLASQVDAVRSIGNFAAHPLKATQTGDIVEVEPGEAEWTLDVLDGLFDFFFVEPAKADARRASWEAKNQSAGKPPLKTS